MNYRKTSWQSYMDMSNRNYQHSNNLIKRLQQHPNSPNRQIWINKVVALGCYTKEDVEYLLENKQ